MAAGAAEYRKLHRADGRAAAERRKINISWCTGPSSSTGIGTISTGCTTVTATVTPADLSDRHYEDDDQMGDIQIYIKSLRHETNRREIQQQISGLEKTLVNILRLKDQSIKRYTIEVLIIEQDGSSMAAITNAVVCALIDAGFQFSSNIVGVSLAAVNGKIFADPTRLEEHAAQCRMWAICDLKHGSNAVSIIHSRIEGSCTISVLEEMDSLASNIAKHTLEDIRRGALTSIFFRSLSFASVWGLDTYAIDS